MKRAFDLSLVFPKDGTTRDKPGRDVPLSLGPKTKQNLVPVSLCPGTRAGAKIPGQTPLSRDVPGQKFSEKMTRFPVFELHFPVFEHSFLF